MLYKPSALGLVVLLTGLALGSARASDHVADLEFDALSLEELTQIPLTSATRASRPLADTASAVYVVTAQDIQRSGHTTLPEILRLVPGLDVARQSSHEWVVGVRGFTGGLSNKLLVMIDGRSVYEPLFGGTHWDVQTPPLDDIERIEVIRGPGAALWGANAVNGVINVITRSAHDTRGSQVSVIAGNQERLIVDLRHGFELTPEADLRISASLTDRDENETLDGDRAEDQQSIARVHGRFDWAPGTQDEVSASFEWYSGQGRITETTFRPDYTDFAGTPSTFDREVWGGSGSLRWAHEFSELSSVEVHGWFDHRNRTLHTINESRRTFELGFQHEWKLAPRHKLIWGLNGRRNDDRIDDTPAIVFGSDEEKLASYGGFFHHEFEVVPERFTLSAGSKLSWNSYTHWEVQPSIRGLYKPRDGMQIWGAISRAVRTPSRGEFDGQLVTLALPSVGTALATSPCPDPVATTTIGRFGCPVSLSGRSGQESEVLTAHELGVRWQPQQDLSLDLAAYWNEIDNLFGLDGTTLVGNNSEEATVLGAELSAAWQVRRWLRLSGSWTGVQIRKRGTRRGMEEEGETPHHHFQLHAHVDLPANFALDTALYYTGRREFSSALRPADTDIGSHTRVDLRLSWRPRHDLELSLVGQDLFDRRHDEFVRSVTGNRRIEIERSIYMRAVWHF